MMHIIHAAGIIFENEHGHILVLRRHPESSEGELWGIAGGKLEPGEDAKTAAIRETQEEIGYGVNPADLQFVKTFIRQVGDTRIVFDAFRLPTLAAKVILHIDPREHTEHQWVNPKALYRRTDLMAGLYPILEDVYGAQSSYN